MPVIGPTFPHDLDAAGLLTLPISWDEDGVYGTEGLTTEQNNDLQDVINAHDPNAPAPRSLDRLMFFQELVTQGEYADFNTWLGSQSESVQVYFNNSLTFAEDDSRVQDAMTALGLTKSAFYDAALT